jgi:Protein of unknown function (DUF4232)
LDRRTGLIGLTVPGIAALCLAAATACASTTNPATTGTPSWALPSLPRSTAPGSPSPSSAASGTGRSPGTGAPTGTSNASACTPAGLAVRTDTSAAATGYSELMIEITDKGSTACGLSGFPTVLGTLGSGGTVRGRDTAEVHLGMVNPGAGPGPVTLAPGASAWIPLNFDDTPVNGANSCPAFASLSITLPGMAQAFTVSALEYGSVYAPDCDGIEVPPVLGAADTVLPSAG